MNDWNVTIRDIDGVKTAVVSPAIPADADPELREGLARRAIVNAGGTCPCGARMAVPNRKARRRARRTGTPIYVTVEHEPGCSAPLERFTR